MQKLRIVDAVRHGFWMPKLPVVESRICKGCGGFGLRGEGVLLRVAAGIGAHRFQ